MKYRPEVDGLRAVAVLPVIFFHAGFGLISGGYVGVDVFFVISGYLITTIILNELRAGTFSIAGFYERRARRILPALFFIIIVSAIAAWFFLIREDFKDFFASVVAVVTFSSNIYFWLEADYFDTATELKPLLHTWSLAVEEQYYIIFPILMMVLWRFGVTLILGLLVLIFCLSLGYAQWIVADDPMTAFYLLPTRAWEIMIGAFCAFYLAREKPVNLALPVQQVLSLLGAAMIAVAVFTFTKDTPTPSVYILVPTVGAAFIILFATPGTLIQSLLSQRIFVGIGLISYSAYLWHQPILAFLRHNYMNEPPKLILATAAIASLVLAWLTWKFIETPFRKSKASRFKILSTSFAGTVAFLALGLFVYLNPDLKYGNGEYNQINAEVALLDYENNNSALQEGSWALFRAYAQSHNGTQDSPNNSSFRDWFEGDDDRIKLLLVGNSHSKDMFNVMFLSDAAQEEIALGRFSTQLGKLGPNHEIYDSNGYADADVVMIVTQFDNRRGDIDQLEPFVQRLIADGKAVVIGRNIFEWPRYLGGNWTLFDKILHEHVSRGIEDPETIVAAANRAYYEHVAEGQKERRIVYANEAVDRLAEAYPEILVVDRMDYLCSDADEICFAADSRLNKYYPDYGHHTLIGAEFFADRAEELDWFAPIIELARAAKGSNS